MDDKTRTEVEAAVYRRLVEHFRKRTDVQNIDLMILSGFCRNCLSKWYRAAAAERGVEMDYDQAREVVYGMPFPEWKAIATLDWAQRGWSGSVMGRYVHDMVQASGNSLSSRFFTDLQGRYTGGANTLRVPRGLLIALDHAHGQAFPKIRRGTREECRLARSGA